MADKSASEQNVQIAQRLQEKFDAYLVGLIFTVLALSIQTAKFGVSPIADLLEIVSWLVFLIAGIAGLSRLEWASEIYRLYGIQTEKEELVRVAQHAGMQGAKELHIVPLGTTVPVSEYVADAKKSVRTVEEAIKPLEKKSLFKYRIRSSDWS
jgi:hypothetical protein